MKYYALILISLFYVTASQSQETAQKLMDRMQTNFVDQDEMAFDFSLTVRIPEQNNIVLDGSLIRSNEKFSATLGDRWIKTDGVTQWVYDPELEEVQIYDASDENSLPMSPEEILKIYNTDDFDFEITKKIPAEEDLIYLVEFKPRDKSSFVVKASIKLYKSTALPLFMKVSERDGTQYTLELDNINSKPSINPNIFTFQAKNYPNLRTEDLRMQE